MKHPHAAPLATAMIAFTLCTGASLARSENRSSYIKPQFLPPSEVAKVLGVRQDDSRGVVEWRADGSSHSVEVRRNDAANLLILSGTDADVTSVENMIRAADVAPRQIAIEATIVEVDRNKALDAGIDWSLIRGNANLNQSDVKRISRFTNEFGRQVAKQTDDALNLSASASLFDALKLLDESGAAPFRDAPRILTLNNRRATVLDGQRVTYITRYSSFTNLFETDTLDAGLTLSVQPSLGESGYLTLDVRAELTSLGGEVSGSPIKDGQIVENVVIVKDGETVLLGGFQRTVDNKVRRRFPVLGHVLPFLFSREITTKSSRESFVAVTARVVDLDARVDPAILEKLERR